jgi:hypothetical protein
MLTRDGLLGESHPEAAFWNRLWDLRSIGDYPCKLCTGTGVRTYGSTATWRGGIGGQAMTPGVCDCCWGSGDAERPWINLRELKR